MGYVHTSRTHLVRLFEADPDLLRWVDARNAAFAEREVVVDAAALPSGDWDPGTLHTEGAPPPTALVVLDGFLTHTVSLHGRTGTELLGPGDVLSPWAGNEHAECLPLTDRWRVLEPVELAVLDRRFEAIAARLPGVMSELVRRQGRQARALATHRALLQIPGLANRVRLMIWCLAERWGRVLPDGYVLPLRLTHGMLADLVGAQRPSVTLALNRLVTEGLLRRHVDGGWIVAGPLPTGLLETSADADAAAGLGASLAQKSLLFVGGALGALLAGGAAVSPPLN
jgi:CRP/FNR family transcriptional regulator, cyclic AMP receptor protein